MGDQLLDRKQNQGVRGFPARVLGSLNRLRSLLGLSKKAAPAVSRPEPENPDLQDKMRRDWDERARENALYYVATGDRDWSQEEFFRSSQQTVEEFSSRLCLQRYTRSG